MCFSTEKHKLFSRVTNEEDDKIGIELKKYKRGDNNDIFITDFTSVKRTELNFQKKMFQPTFKTITEIMNECAIYEIVNVRGLVYNLQDEEHVDKDGKPLRMRKAQFKDETDSIEIVLFSNFIDQVTDNKCYDFQKLRIQKFQSRRVLKSTEMSSATISKNFILTLSEDELLSTSKISITAKVVSLDMSTFDVKMLCPNCKTNATPDNSIVWCDTCSHVSSEELCIKVGDVKITALNTATNEKVDLTVSHEIITNCFNCSISIETKKDIAKKMMHETYELTYDSSKNKCKTMNIVGKKKDEQENISFDEN